MSTSTVQLALARLRDLNLIVPDKPVVQRQKEIPVYTLAVTL